MYVRLQTWFPFEIQVGINGREWLARQLDRENLKYERSENKFLWIEDWQRAQQLLDEQLQTDWVRELSALQKQVHPSHPRLLGPMPVPYNWTVFQSEWAADAAFASEEVLQPHFDRWLRQAFLNFGSIDVLRFLGRSQRITKHAPLHLETSFYDRFDGKRIKHWSPGAEGEVGQAAPAGERAESPGSRGYCSLGSDQRPEVDDPGIEKPRRGGCLVPRGNQRYHCASASLGPRHSPATFAPRPWLARKNTRNAPLPSTRGGPYQNPGAACRPQRKP